MVETLRLKMHERIMDVRFIQCKLSFVCNSVFVLRG